jgi:hypothetical protein
LGWKNSAIQGVNGFSFTKFTTRNWAVLTSKIDKLFIGIGITFLAIKIGQKKSDIMTISDFLSNLSLIKKSMKIYARNNLNNIII